MSFNEKSDAENLWKCWEECLDKSDYYSQKAMVEEFNTKKILEKERDCHHSHEVFCWI